jgi:putative tricarboxylic transport membrane protein
MAEEQLRKAMAISQGDILYLVHSPFAIVAYSALAVIIATGLWLKRRKAKIEAAPKLVPTSAISAIEEPPEGRR